MPFHHDVARQKSAETIVTQNGVFAALDIHFEYVNVQAAETFKKVELHNSKPTVAVAGHNGRANSIVGQELRPRDIGSSSFIERDPLQQMVAAQIGHQFGEGCGMRFKCVQVRLREQVSEVHGGITDIGPQIHDGELLVARHDAVRAIEIAYENLVSRVVIVGCGRVTTHVKALTGFQGEANGARFAEQVPAQVCNTLGYREEVTKSLGHRPTYVRSRILPFFWRLARPATTDLD